MSSTTSVSSSNRQPALQSRQDIFESLAAKTCKVVWSPTQTPKPYDKPQEQVETSGCFIRKANGGIRVLTCFHEPEWQHYKITIIYQSKTFNGGLGKEVSLDLALQHDLTMIDVDAKSENFPFFDITVGPSFPSLGEKIYFAGFPLGEREPLIHKGYISSSELNNGSFKIDGTVVRGHSGGPVARMQADQLELIGIVNSQLVNLTDQLVKISHLELPRFRAYNDHAPTYAKDTNVITVVNQLVGNLLSNLSTGIGTARFITLHLFISYPFPKRTVPISTMLSAKTVTNELGYIQQFQEQKIDDYGASSVFQSMQGDDPWVKKHLRSGTGNDSPLETTSHPSMTRELPVMKGEHVPAKSNQHPEVWNWVHYLKTNKRALFNKITGRADNRGKDNSRGKDNVSNDEFELCIQYHYIMEKIDSKSEDPNEIHLDINSSKLNEEAKKMLRDSLNPAIEAEETDFIEKVEEDVKNFIKKASELKPKALKQRKGELEKGRDELKQRVNTLVEDAKKKQQLISKLESCLNQY